MHSMAIPVMKFQVQEYFFLLLSKNACVQKKLIKWIDGNLSKEILIFKI